jgi:mono/diheme cytochrome c family protein
MIIPRNARSLLIAMSFLAIGFSPVTAQEDEKFMPKGGKTLFLELADSPRAAELREIGNISRTEAEWRSFLVERHKQLSEREVSELAAYLAVNLPLPEGTVQQAESGDIASALPPDGRELAWTQCQFCHSLFTSYLTQQRDVQGWRSTFLSPFHRGLKMTAQQRETFARYSATNMPMKAADVPAALRY